MKKVICFSLWGDNPTYTIGAIKNAKLAEEIYPGWICRYYVGKSTPTEIINQLIEFDNTEVFIMNESGNWTGMFWRFYAASDQNVGVMISRDTDSRLTKREKAAVDEWLASDKDFHIMRDHPQHATEILGGMWGVRNKLLIGMVSGINDYAKGDFWQVDQNFLREKIYPAIINNKVVHDEFFEKNNFPEPRLGYEFIGEAFDKDDNLLYPEHREMLKAAVEK